MQHFFTIPINDAGLITDPQIVAALRTALDDPFVFDDFYLYSHGWWTNANRAMVDYNRFSIEFARIVQKLGAADKKAARSSLAIGIHWPSMITEDQGSLLGKLQAASYYTMEHRADVVGTNGLYALLRVLAEKRNEDARKLAPGSQPPPLRINLIGHSFGCKVVCAALEELNRWKTMFPAQTEINVVLLQAAFDDSALDPKGLYQNVLKVYPSARFLITTSDWDIALKEQYPAAERGLNIFAAKRQALGYHGPAKSVIDAFGAAQLKAFDVQPESDCADVAQMQQRMLVANLTPIHKARHEADVQNAKTAKANGEPYTPQFESHSGHHSDIFLPEVYCLLRRFLG